MSVSPVRRTTRTLMIFASLSAAASSFLLSCGPEPQTLGSADSLAIPTHTASPPDRGVEPGAESLFSVSYRIYRSRSATPRKFGDLIPTSWFKDIERKNEDDYAFDFLHPSHPEKGDATFTLMKWPTKNEDDVYVELKFRIPLENFEVGKTVECPFVTSPKALKASKDNDCSVSGDIGSVVRRERLFLPSVVKSPPVVCRIKVSESTININADAAALKSIRLPAQPGSPEARERLAFGFQCDDTKNRLVALKGTFLQNTTQPPVLVP